MTRAAVLFLVAAGCARSHPREFGADAGSTACLAQAVKPTYGDLGRLDGKAERSATGNLFFTAVLPPDGGAHPDFLSVEFYRAGAGAYDLAGSDYQSCKACVLLLADQDPARPADPPAAYYLATAGKLTVALDGDKLSGALADVKLARVTIDSDGESPTYETHAKVGANCTPASTTIGAATFEAPL